MHACVSDRMFLKLLAVVMATLQDKELISWGEMLLACSGTLHSKVSIFGRLSRLSFQCEVLVMNRRLLSALNFGYEVLVVNRRLSTAVCVISVGSGC